MPCGQPKLSSMPSAPASCVFLVISCHASRLRLDHERHEQGPIGKCLLDPRDFFQVDVERPVGDQFNIIKSHHLAAVIIDGPVTRRDVDDRLAGERLPDGPAPSGLEGATDLVFGVGRRPGRQPERIGRLDPAEFDRQVGHVAPALRPGHSRSPAPASARFVGFPVPRSYHLRRHPRFLRRFEGSRHRQRVRECWSRPVARSTTILPLSHLSLAGRRPARAVAPGRVPSRPYRLGSRSWIRPSSSRAGPGVIGRRARFARIRPPDEAFGAEHVNRLCVPLKPHAVGAGELVLVGKSRYQRLRAPIGNRTVSAPSRLAAVATSIAVLPAPITTTFTPT